MAHRLDGDRAAVGARLGCALLAVALALPPAPMTAQASGRIGVADPLSIGETFTLESKVLAETRRINVYLPAPYISTPDLRLPVLYMPDGGMAEDFLHIAGLVQISVANGTMRPFIVVGIENTQRRRDLTGPTTDPEDHKIAPVVGGAAAFRTFIRSELIPAIGARYRTTAERAIVGESLAGLFVVETLFEEPDLFDTYIAFDPSLWWNRGALLAAAPARIPKLGSRSRTLYLASSSEAELARVTSAMAGRLRRHAPRALRWEYVPMPAETHATIYHPAALRAFRRVLAPDRADPAGGPAAAMNVPDRRW